MQRRTLVFALFFLLVGCPELSLGPLTVKDGSVDATKVTLTAEITVTEADETEGADQQRQSGRALLGVQLPAGWTVTAARMRSPRETVDRALFASPQGAAALAEGFPTAEGVWWGFTSPSQEIPQGSWPYSLEIDIERPKKAKAGLVGVSVSVLNDDLSDLSAPRQYDLAFKGKSATLSARKPLSGGTAFPEPAPEDDTSKAPTGG